MTKTAAKESDLDIEFIPGHTNILLIAPHGVETEPFDDENTAELTRKIAKILKCSAIINHIYRKPDDTKKEKRNGGKPDLENMYLDLNKFHQAKLHPDFITNIKNIVENKNPTTVIWIHGIDDDNIDKNVDCLIGYGQPKRHTIKDEQTIELLIKHFKNNSLNAKSAENGSDYCGWAKDNMNQLFRLNKKYDFEQVQSIQLEFRYSGVRRRKNLAPSAQKIVSAISAFIKSDPDSSPTENKTPVIPEIVEENPKVEEAYQHLKDIFIKHISNAMLEAGQYLIGQFYGGDYKVAEQKPFTHNQSLNQLFDKLQNEASGNAPKKSWLYNSINLAIAEETYNEVSTYGNLGHSHKILLINVKEKLPEKIKISLMEETVAEGHTVVKLQERIVEEKNKLDPDHVSSGEVNQQLASEQLKEFSVKKLRELKRQTQKQANNVESKLNLYQENLKKIETVIKEKPLEPKRKSAKTPKIISVSRRTDIPALYSDWFFNRVKQGFVQVKGHIENKTTKTISLLPDDVRCFVFWTKNPGPMIDKLHLLDEQGYKYYFQFTLTPYDQKIEPFLPPKEKIVETFIKLSRKIGKEKVIWRYDPILLNDKIDIEYHKKHFLELIEKLHLYTNKCVISFIDTPKSKENKEKLNLKKITKELMREIAKEFHHINKKYKINIATCSENIDLTNFEISPGKCVDDKLIGNIIGHELSIPKDSSQRKSCGCVKSEDIGTHETCTHGCLFCYATKEHKEAISNFRQHNKKSPLLIGKMEDIVKEKA